MNPTISSAHGPKTILAITIAIVTLLAVGGGFWLISLSNDSNNTETEQSTTPSPTLTTTPTTTAVGPSLYIARTTNYQESFNWETIKTPLDKDGDQAKKQYDAKYGLTYGPFNSTGVDRPVQWSDDGNIIAYSTGMLDEGFGLDDLNNFNLSVIANDVETTVLRDVPASTIPRWLLLPDGSRIIYFKVTGETGSEIYELYSYDINSNIHTQLLNKVSIDYLDLTSNARESILDNNGSAISLILEDVVAKEVTLWTYSLATGKQSTRSIYKKNDGLLTESQFVLSHDGTKVAYRSDYNKISIIDFSTNSTTELADVGVNYSTNNLTWSADDSKIAYVTTIYGNADGTVELVLQDVTTKVKQTLKQSKITNSSGKHIIMVDFSSDNQYLLYIYGDSVILYNFLTSTEQVIDSNDLYQNSWYQLVSYQWINF